MNRVIEQVVTSDESARDTVARARDRAQALVTQAEEEAATIVNAGRQRLEQLEISEIQPVIARARQQAREIQARNDRSIGRLQATVAEKKDRILDEFLRSVLGTGIPPQDDGTRDFPGNH